MRVIKSELPEVLILEPRVFTDERGFFLETFQQQRYAEVGIGCEFVQDNFSRSARGTLRGLHYQLERPQAKLATVLRGAVFDVAVDLACDSPRFGKWVGVELNESNHRQLFIPAGFAHGFYVLSDVADFQYKCSDVYHAPGERTLLWNDPQLGIAWPVAGSPLLSDKDRKGTPFAQAECYASTPL